jgi:hypothetical protein
MNYYYVNTEAKNLGGRSPHEIWVKQKRAFVSGEAYGQKLGRLTPGDICFMYVNGHGVMAVGRVRKHWNGQPSDPPMVYTPSQGPEYQITVDWFLTLQDNPISPRVLRDIVGWTSPQAVQQITDHAAAERLLNYARQQADHG